MKSVEELKKKLIDIHPEAEVQELGKFTFITEKLEFEEHSQIIYTINNEKDELKVCIGSYVANIRLDAVTLDNIQSVLFHHGTHAGLSPKYLRRLTGGY